MTTVPKPSDLTSTYACTYDAWNRLAEVRSGEIVVAKYEYDALNRRTKECVDTDTDGDFDEYRHFYYTDGWQLLETRVSTEDAAPETLQPEYQYVWSLRYLDAPVLRDKNTDDDDLCDDQRLYFTNDANMNVTALVGTDGTVLERYVYDPYGNCTVYDDDWSDTVSWANSKKNNIRYCGYYFDNETGLYHVRNRYYHPYFGWITRDPAGYADGMGLYEYCAGGPLGALDPLGLGPITGDEPVFEFRVVRHGDWEWGPLGPAGPLTGGLEKKKPAPNKEKTPLPPEWTVPLQLQDLDTETLLALLASGVVDWADWREGVSADLWQGVREELGLNLEDYIKDAAGMGAESNAALAAYLSMSPEERAQYDAQVVAQLDATAPETVRVAYVQYGFSLEGSAGFAHTFDAGVRIYASEGFGFGEVKAYIEPAVGLGSPSASACITSGAGIVMDVSSRADLQNQSYGHGHIGGGGGEALTVGGTINYAQSGNTSSYGYTAEVGVGVSLPLPASGRAAGGPGVELELWGWGE